MAAVQWRGVQLVAGSALAIGPLRETRSREQVFAHIRVRALGDGRVSDIRVGGTVVPVMEGRIRLA